MASSWNLGNLYKSTWQLIKTQPKLWLVGLAVAVLSSTPTTDFNSNFSSRNAPEATPSPPIEQQLPVTPFQTVAYRLGTAVIPPLRTVPSSIYLLLAAEIVIALLGSLVIAAIASAWSRGSLIRAINQAHTGNRVDLATASRASINKLKTVIGIDTIPWLRLTAVMAVAIIAAAIAINLKLAVLAPLIIVPAVVYSIIYAIRILFAQIWAYRAAIITNTDYAASMQTGHTLSQSRKGNMLVLGIANTVVGGLTAVALIVISGAGPAIAVFNAVSDPNTQSVIVAAATVLTGITLAYPLMFIRQTFLNVFTYAVWNLAYKEINETKT